MNVLGSASSIPQPSRGTTLSRGTASMRGAEAEPTTPSRELAAAIARAHYLWAKRFAPHLLQEWTA